MKWHIIGADGYIGTKLYAYLPADVQALRYVQPKTALRDADVKFELTDFDESAFSQVDEGDFVVMLAAISSPDVCEKEYIYAHSVNVDGTIRFINGCIERKANVLFFSSDVVNGATTPYMVDENYHGTPLGRYAEMKLEVENRFRDEPNFKAFRLSYVYSRYDKFSRYLDSCLQKGETAEVFDCLYRNAVYLDDILDAAVKLSKSFDTWDNTVFNLSGSQLLSRKDMAQIYRQVVDSRLSIEIAQPPEDFFKARPNIIATKSLYLQRLLGRAPLDIAEAMRREYSIN